MRTWSVNAFVIKHVVVCRVAKKVGASNHEYNY